MTSTNNIGGTNNLAIASLILSILFVVAGPLGSIPAIICGRMALKEYKLAGVTQGTGMAKTGLWIGWIGLILFILSVVVTIIIYLSLERKSPEETIQIITPIEQNQPNKQELAAPEPDF